MSAFLDLPLHISSSHLTCRLVNLLFISLIKQKRTTSPRRNSTPGWRLYSHWSPLLSTDVTSVESDSATAAHTLLFSSLLCVISHQIEPSVSAPRSLGRPPPLADSLHSKAPPSRTPQAQQPPLPSLSPVPTRVLSIQSFEPTSTVAETSKWLMPSVSPTSIDLLLTFVHG